MIILRSSAMAAALALVSSAALAQAPAASATQTSSSSTATAEETRPATTTFFGDTGLWYVPTGEVLAKGKWSTSAYRRGTNWQQGYTNVADFAGTFGYGIGGRAAHEKGTAHEWTADEARNAGRKGGQVSRGGRGRLIVPVDAPPTAGTIADGVAENRAE